MIFSSNKESSIPNKIKKNPRFINGESKFSQNQLFLELLTDRT